MKRREKRRTSNDDPLPSIAIDSTSDCLELTLNDGHGLVRFAFLEGFADAGNDRETCAEGGFGL